MRWSDEQIEEAARIVNNIAEDIDNRETRKKLRQALVIYADLLQEKQSRINMLADTLNLMARKIIETLSNQEAHEH